MDVADFDYPLPPERIAQAPAAERAAARLLVDRGPVAPPDHAVVADLPELLVPGDVLVVNDTRVVPARLALRKPTGGAVEVLLLEQRADGTWEAMVRGSRRVATGAVLESTAGDDLRVEVLDAAGGERRVVRLCAAGDPWAALERHGKVPLPPYITDRLDDPDRYQTVFADRPASAAAPTAGLHLTEALFDRVRARGVTVATIDLAVGLDTFRPMKGPRVEQHTMHGEHYRVPRETWRACVDAQTVVAVGTTTVRALESAAETGALEGRTELFIHGDYPFRVVDRLLTNFHLPKSSLLVMIEAFVGPHWRDLYAVALERDYRFLSFGDAMLLTRHDRRRVS